MNDLSKRDVAHLLDQWTEVTFLHDCWSCEISLDAAIRANRDLAAELGRTDAALDGARLTIARQALRLAALEGELTKTRRPGRLLSW